MIQNEQRQKGRKRKREEGKAASETEKGLAMGCYTEPTWNVGERLGGQRLFFILQNIRDTLSSPVFCLVFLVEKAVAVGTSLPNTGCQTRAPIPAPGNPIIQSTPAVRFLALLFKFRSQAKVHVCGLQKAPLENGKPKSRQQEAMKSLLLC
jgi:hypothetical protein